MNIGFVTIPVNSLEDTIKFYKEIMDFEVVTRFGSPEQLEIAFMADKKGSQLEFIQRKGQQVQHDGLISIGFNIEDMEATVEYLKSHQVNILEGPHTLPSGVKLLHAQDLNGVALGFVQRP